MITFTGEALLCLMSTAPPCEIGKEIFVIESSEGELQTDKA